MLMWMKHGKTVEVLYSFMVRCKRLLWDVTNTHKHLAHMNLPARTLSKQIAQQNLTQGMASFAP